MFKSLSSFFFFELIKTNSLSQVPRRLSQGSQRVGWLDAWYECWVSAALTPSSQKLEATRGPWEAWVMLLSCWARLPRH